MRTAAPQPAPASPLTLAVVAAAIVLCCTYAALLVANSIQTGQSWFFRANGLPHPTDFAAYRVAGLMALGGDAAAAYDWQFFAPAIASFVGFDQDHWLGWLNPPSFLLIIAPLAMLPYGTAALAWVAATGLMYLAAARAALPRSTVLLACAAPAAFACLLKGQSGFLSAALIGAGLLLLDRRPVLAGLCFGLLSYKPHFGIALPILLLVGGHFRAVSAAAATVAVMAGLSAMVFGPEAWVAFAGTVVGATDRFLVQGSGLARMQSVYAAAAPALGKPLAMVLHGCVAAAAIGAAAFLWRRGAAPAGPRGAAAIAATFLATPYAFDHDAPMLVLAALMLVPWRADGRAGMIEAILLCATVLVMAATLVTPTSIPGPLAALVLLGLAWRAAGRFADTAERIDPGAADPAT